jgi:hypothetical protein
MSMGSGVLCAKALMDARVELPPSELRAGIASRRRPQFGPLQELETSNDLSDFERAFAKS